MIDSCGRSGISMFPRGLNSDAEYVPMGNAFLQ